MKTDDWVLLAGAAAIAWILTRRPGATIAAAPPTTRPRTGTVTVGALTPGAAKPSLYEAGNALRDAWTDRPGNPTLADWLGY